MLDSHDHTLSSDVIRMFVSSVTHNGEAQLTELEADCLLYAIARASSGVPTGVRKD